jgi:hypothetical protein
MTHRLKRAMERSNAVMARLWQPEPMPETVHFHLGERGRLYACENPRCDSPAL